MLAALTDGLAPEELGETGGDPGKKAGVIERRRIWTDDLLAGYMPRGEAGGHEKERVNIATGEVRECWYLLTSLSSRRCGPKELLKLFRQHWTLHHVKDRSWDEDVHTLRRPGLGEVFAR